MTADRKSIHLEISPLASSRISSRGCALLLAFLLPSFMASSLGNAPSIMRIPDRTCLPGSATFASQSFFQKEIFGSSVIHQQNLLLPTGFGRDHLSHRRITIEAAKRVDNKRTFILSSSLKAQKKDVEQVAKLCGDIRKWALEKMKDKAVGLRQFECYVDVYDKNVFHFMEEYSSVLHMNDFRASPEHTKFCNDVRPFLLEPIALAAYEQRDGQVGFMVNPIGPKGEGGLDDATGQAGKGGEAYMKPKAKKRRGIEFELESKPALQDASKIDAQGANEKVESNKWSFEKVLARVIGLDTDADVNTSSESSKEEQWSLMSLFRRK